MGQLCTSSRSGNDKYPRVGHQTMGAIVFSTQVVKRRVIKFDSSVHNILKERRVTYRSVSCVCLSARIVVVLISDKCNIMYCTDLGFIELLRYLGVEM